MKKKILYLHHGKGLGGAPLSLLYLIQKLDLEKYEPIVLFLHASEAMTLYEENDITIVGPVNRYDFPHTKIWWHRWFHMHRFMKIIFDTLVTIFFDGPRWIKSIKPDLLHLNTSSLIAWALVAHRYKIPVVWHIREPLAQGYFGIRRRLISWIIKKYATHIIPISKHDGLPWIKESKTTVLHNPVDTKLFYPAFTDTNMRAHLKIPPTSPVILFLGGISKEKGTDTILQAFEKLLKRQPNSYLIIAGAHPYEHDTRFALHYILSPSARYLEQIRVISKRLGNHVIFTGPSRKIPSLMALSTVVVFPASVGHFARPIIEAACMAKPVIASALPPLQELVIDQTTGYLLPPHDIDAWTDHLEKIIIHPSLATKLGNHAYHLSTRYHSDIYAKKISTIYKTILKGTHE